jgi:hypothetical protein
MEEWMERFLLPVLRHREEGHALRFQPKKKGEAKIYCFTCHEDVADGDRDMINAMYESVLQWPVGPKVCAGNLPSV